MIDIQAALDVAAHGGGGRAAAGGGGAGAVGAGRGHPAAAAWRWRTRAGRCGRRRPSCWRAFDEAALLPSLEAALRDDENAAPAQRGHGDLREDGRRPPAARCCGLLGDPDEEVRNFAAVMLGERRDGAGGGAADRGAGRPRRQRAPRGRGQPGPDRRPRARCTRSSRSCTASPGCSTRPSTRWPSWATRAARPRCWSCWPTSMLRGPVLEALGRLAGREALPRLVPHLYDPDPTLRNMAIQAVVAIEQRATAAGESLDPGGAGGAAARGPGGPPAGHAGRGRPGQPPHGRHHAGLAEGAAGGARR